MYRVEFFGYFVKTKKINKMKEHITPCLWYNGKGKEAAEFYCSILKDTKIVAESPFVTEIEVSGQNITCLDGGPIFQPNPSISLTYQCDTEEEINRIWEAFSKDGSIIMDIDKYPWSERYGWINDKYGISWQLIVGDFNDFGKKVIPSLLFGGQQRGKAEEAINLYTSIFKNAQIDGIYRYEGDEAPGMEGKLAHSQINLNGSKLILTDSHIPQDVPFTEGVSLMIHCKDQEEIDYYWYKLTDGGEESMCGWLKDKFGVSWQVTPDILLQLMKNPETAQKAMEAFMPMRKLEIDKILDAVNSDVR